MNVKHFLYWVPMVLIAFTNAALRELLIIKHFNEFQAHQLSTVTLTILCSVYVWFIYPLLDIQNSKQALLIGLVWVLLTASFEFSLGRITNTSWEYLLQAYNLFAGRIWSLFLLCLFLLPYLFYTVRK